jgi:acyl carrier protein
MRQQVTAMAETLDYTTYAARVAEFLGLEPAAVLRPLHLYDQLGLDSLGMFSLGMYLIKCFGIKLPLSEVATIATVGDLYEALSRHRPQST